MPDDKLPAKVEPPKSGYRCGCEPGLLCMSHAIRRMDQKDIDRILDRINTPKR